MGMDIESFVQVYDSEVKSWKTVKTSIAGDLRSYAYFNLLGQDSRCNEYKILYPLRGLPKDIQLGKVDTLMQYHIYEKDGEQLEFPFSTDARSGWLTLEEMENINAFFDNLACIQCFGQDDDFVDESSTIEDDIRQCPDCKCCEKHANQRFSQDHFRFNHEPAEDKDWCLGALRKVLKVLRDIAKQHNVGNEHVKYVFGFNC
jgi:hypothetical protein